MALSGIDFLSLRGVLMVIVVSGFVLKFPSGDLSMKSYSYSVLTTAHNFFEVSFPRSENTLLTLAFS